jgi:hypothetical protein
MIISLEAAFTAVVTSSKAQGWTSQETATALLKIATEHARQIEDLSVEGSAVDAA